MLRITRSNAHEVLSDVFTGTEPIKVYDSKNRSVQTDYHPMQFSDLGEYPPDEFFTLVQGNVSHVIAFTEWTDADRDFIESYWVAQTPPE
jgi:hypothetical protein